MKRNPIEKECTIACVGYSIELSNAEMRGVQHIANLVECIVSRRLHQFEEECKDGSLPAKMPVIKLTLEDALNLNAFLQQVACTHLDNHMFMSGNNLASLYEKIVGVKYPTSYK